MLRRFLVTVSPFFVGLLFGCEVEIGDECTTAADCSQEEPRLCLTQALEGYPGGYCTVFNCDPGTCPGEAVCVGYRSSLSDTAECGGAFAETRLQRTFCMKSCGSSSDCRSGYACLDLGEDDPWGAVILEREGRNTKVCALAYSGPELPEDRPSDVCRNVPQLPSSVALDGGTSGGVPSAVAPDAGGSSGVDASLPVDGTPDGGDVAVPDAAGLDAAAVDAATPATVDAATPATVRSDAAIPTDAAR
jgi:hypothetical protein